MPLTPQERAAIARGVAGLLVDSREAQLRGMKERSDYSAECAERMKRLLERDEQQAGGGSIQGGG